ncbi:MAG: copper amine oxidase N-terminal domain-containing protein [Clostridiales bacterium]|jgi:hypothetical protein|nr:copper amine oxidase N-terminal domain-containing protein [Clostridiales bacterium]
MKRLKTFAAGAALSLALSATAAGVFAAEPLAAYLATFPIYVNGAELAPELPAVAIDGRTYLPLAAIGDALGASVRWNAEFSRVEALPDKGLGVSLGDYSPERNSSMTLLVYGDGFDGAEYQAYVIYKSTYTEYTGKVGEPIMINVSTAEAGREVPVFVTVGDVTLKTSFTPKAR